MADFRQLAIDLIAADNNVDVAEVRLLRKHLYADNRITHAEISFLMDLWKKVKTATPAFQKFYLKAMGDSFLDNRIISHEEIGMIKKMLADKKLAKPEVKKFLARVKKEAIPNPDFDKVYDDYMKK
jgi:hypothetical protein